MIIKDLIDRNINFAVIKYYSWLTRAKIIQNEEWEVLIPRSEAKKAKGIFLTGARDLSAGSKSRILSLEEISEFRYLLPRHFNCVERNEHGAVWERNDTKNTRELLTPKNW